MRVILFGAHGTIGKPVSARLKQAGHEVVEVGRSSGTHRADLGDRSALRTFYSRIGAFDAVASAAGEVAFAPFEKLGTGEWEKSLSGKLLGQVQMVQEAVPFIKEGGCFTLVSGILSGEAIKGGVAASAVNRALEGFAMAAAVELPRRLRINVISPTVLVEAMGDYAPFFPGFEPVAGGRVADAYLKAIAGAMTGQTIKVGW